VTRPVRRRGDDGVSTVEFALVLPVFVVLVGIATYFSWMFYVQAQVDRAADRAARYAAVPYVTSTVVQKNIDQNGNIIPGTSVNVTIVNAYSTTEYTTNYHYCVNKILDKVNRDLFTGTASVDFASTSTANDDVTVSDYAGPLDKTKACGKPVGFVKVQVKKDFTNPFSILLAPFTGTTSSLEVTGTGRARVESP
jgi:Flp pilus assembly protein TadG